MSDAKLILMVRLLAYCPHVLTGATAERLDPDEVSAELGQWADALLARCVVQLPEGERQPPGPEPTGPMMRALKDEAATICDVSCPCCGAGIEVAHGDEPGSIVTYGTPMPLEEADDE